MWKKRGGVTTGARRGRVRGWRLVEILQEKNQHNSEEVFLLRLEIFPRFIFMELADF
jgi:hypothetical protein